MSAKRFFTTLPIEALGDRDLTALDLRCLGAIASYDGMSMVKGKGGGCFAKQAKVAALANTDATNFSKSLKRLVTLGYVIQETHLGDRRKKVLRVQYPGQLDKRCPKKVVGQLTNYRQEIVGDATYKNGANQLISAGDYIPLNGIIKNCEEMADDREAKRFAERETVKAFWSLVKLLPKGFAGFPPAGMVDSIDKAFTEIGRAPEFVDSREIDAFSDLLHDIIRNHPDDEHLVSQASKLINEFGSARHRGCAA